MVAKEALAQPISAWPCIRDLNLPPKKRVPFFFSEKHYDASSSVIYNLYGSSAYRYLPLTNRDPELLRRPSPPWLLQKNFMFRCFREKIKDKIACFSLVNARICKNNVEMFLLAGKTLETFNFISFYWLSLHFDS